MGYYVDGQGPELVLVHGGTGHPETSFASLLEEFTPHRTTIVPGYSGSTLTPLPDGEVDVDLLADQVLGVVRAAANGPVDMFGISTGAVVAAAVASKDAELIRRLVVLGGFVHYRHPWQRLLLRTWRRLADLDADAFAEYTLLHVLSDAFLDSMSASERLRLRAGLAPSEGMVALIDFVGQVDISGRVGDIKSPTLVVGMRHDQLVPVRYAKQFHAAIPGSEYVEIDSGHAAAIEKPAELLKHIKEFLAQ
ncbi:alpha/beta fold hydrolase [Actinomadura soli]|uniref:alpha/beta fold hydrolase n=1 Tax=Actinomadura soli TaxID=2508997 RepID=UPI001486FCEE|nr:alpha/beta hydrolase [Actinomadura soli]